MVARRYLPAHTVGEGFHALPAWVDGLPWFARKKWCAGGARGIGYAGRWTRGRRAVGGVGAVGHAERVHPTRPGGLAATVHRGRCPLRVGAKQTLRRIWQCVRFPSRLTKGARAVPAILHTLDGGSYRAHRRKHGCNRPRRPSAPTLPRQSRNRGAPRTVRPTSWQQNERCGMKRNGCRQSQTINSAHLTAPLKHTHTQPP